MEEITDATEASRTIMEKSIWKRKGNLDILVIRNISAGCAGELPEDKKGSRRIGSWYP
ncbi:hypothetical protein [Pedobacter jeongneungensis]|uniref:hypothetical protein n=1 Tax=Pedobacter jeongneungensis TaxID=947309 RepID=UPI0013B46CE3|nr:hypothetical protein [Pedobacter jeongneungensis]